MEHHSLGWYWYSTVEFIFVSFLTLDDGRETETALINFVGQIWNFIEYNNFELLFLS